MKAALFLDVDITLTAGYIQSEFARYLDCLDEYTKIEGDFQNHKDAIKFGDDIVKLFSEKNFQESQADDVFNKVRLQPWAVGLLKLPLDKYLVSSGPSYYIDRLARKYDIPLPDRVCRSEYIFDPITHIIKDCNAVDGQQKAFFVNKFAANYDITIGIGDNPEHDAFVTHCTFPILTAPSVNYLHATNLPVAIRLIESILDIINQAEQNQAKVVPVEIDAEHMSIPQVLTLLRRFTIGSWILLFALLGTIFTAGTLASSTFFTTAKTPPANATIHPGPNP